MGVGKDDERKQAALTRINESGVFPGQKYRHWSTEDVYVVVAVGLFEPNLEPMVHYRIDSDPYAIVWTRELDVFCGFTLDDRATSDNCGRGRSGVPVKRFERVD